MGLLLTRDMPEDHVGEEIGVSPWVEVTQAGDRLHTCRSDSVRAQVAGARYSGECVLLCLLPG